MDSRTLGWDREVAKTVLKDITKKDNLDRLLWKVFDDPASCYHEFVETHIDAEGIKQAVDQAYELLDFSSYSMDKLMQAGETLYAA